MVRRTGEGIELWSQTTHLKRHDEHYVHPVILPLGRVLRSTRNGLDVLSSISLAGLFEIQETLDQQCPFVRGRFESD